MILFNLKLSQIGLNGTYRIKDKNRMTNRIIEHGNRKTDYALFLDEQSGVGAFGLYIVTMDPNKHTRIDIFIGYQTTFDENDNIELVFDNSNIIFQVKCYNSLYSDLRIRSEYEVEDMNLTQLKKISVELCDHFTRNINPKKFLEWIAYSNYKMDLKEIGEKYEN